MIRIPQTVQGTDYFRFPEIFGVLSREDIERIKHNKIIVKYRRGETIIKQNARATQAFFILSGFARVLIEGDNEKSLILKYTKKDDFIGISGFYTNKIYSFTVSTIEECTACFIDYSLLSVFIKDNPLFAHEIIKNLCNEKSCMFNKLLSLTQKQSPGKVAEVILYLRNEIFNADEKYILASRNDIADLTGITKDSAGRILKDFSDNAIVEFDGKTIKVLDDKKLQKISDLG